MSKAESKAKTGSTLCDLIWERDWDAVQTRLATSEGHRELQSYNKLPCFSNGGKGMPIHLACVMRPLPPAYIVETLLTFYPESAHQKTSMWSLLPLHLAVDLRQTTISSSSDDETKKNRKKKNIQSTKAGATAKVTFPRTELTTKPAAKSADDSAPIHTCASPGHACASPIHTCASSHSSQTSSVSSSFPDLSLTHSYSSSSPQSLKAVTRATADDEDNGTHNGTHYRGDFGMIWELNDHCKVVQLLVEAYPGALEIPEEFHGMLPLHIAASSTPTVNGKVPPHAAFIMQRLLTLAPFTLQSKDSEGDTPFVLAQRANQQQISMSTASFTVNLQQSENKGPVVGPFPDWKWNPLLYPPPQYKSKNKGASLLVGTLDDLMNLSSYSDDSYSKGGTSFSSSVISSNFSISDSDENSDTCPPVDVLDEDDMDKEWKQLAKYQEELKTELEDSIRMYCSSYQLEDDEMVVSVSKAFSSDRRETVEAKIDNNTEGGNITEMDDIRLEDTRDTIAGIVSETTLEEAVADASRVVDETVDIILNTLTAESERKSIFEENDDDMSEEIENLSAAEDSLRHDLESVAGYNSFMQLTEKDDNDKTVIVQTFLRPRAMFSMDDVPFQKPLTRNIPLSLSSGGFDAKISGYQWNETQVDPEVTLVEQSKPISNKVEKKSCAGVMVNQKSKRVFIGCRELPSCLWGLPSIRESFSLEDETPFPFSAPLSPLSPQMQVESLETWEANTLRSPFLKSKHFNAEALDVDWERHHIPLLVKQHDKVAEPAATEWKRVKHSMVRANDTNATSIFWRRVVPPAQTVLKPATMTPTPKSSRECEIVAWERTVTSKGLPAADSDFATIQCAWIFTNDGDLKQPKMLPPASPSIQNAGKCESSPSDESDNSSKKWNGTIANTTTSGRAVMLSSLPSVTNSMDSNDSFSEIKLPPSKDEKPPRKSSVPNVSMTELTELSQQLTRLQEENDRKDLEMERLKQRASIMSEVKGVSTNDLRSALESICKKDKASTIELSKTILSQDGSCMQIRNRPSREEVLGHWYQEICAQERDADQTKNHPTPSMSPPRIVKTNIGANVWSIGELDTVSNAVAPVTAPETKLSDWGDELMQETGLSTSIKDPPKSATWKQSNVPRKETKAATKARYKQLASTTTMLSDITVIKCNESKRAGMINGKVQKKCFYDDQFQNDSLDVMANAGASSRHNRLRSIIEKRKLSGCLLSSDRRLERLFTTSSYTPKTKVTPRDHREIDSLMERSSSSLSEKSIEKASAFFRQLPPPPPPPVPPPALKCSHSRSFSGSSSSSSSSGLTSVTNDFEDFILSPPKETTIEDLLQDSAVEAVPHSYSSRSVQISVQSVTDNTVKDDASYVDTEVSAEKCFDNEKPMVEWACGENFHDGMQACIDNFKEFRERIPTAFTEMRSEMSERTSSFAPGLVGFVDKLALDLDKAIFGLSDFVESIAPCGDSSPNDVADDRVVCGVPATDKAEVLESRRASSNSKKTSTSSWHCGQRNTCMTKKKKSKRSRRKSKFHLCGLELRSSSFI